MAVNLDPTDWAILEQLQHDGRMPLTELAGHVHLSASATTERVRRLESAGVISGYHAQIDLASVGWTLLAVVRLKHYGSTHDPLHQHLEMTPNVLECLRITGEDCYIVKVAATSMPQLEELVNDLGRYGDTHTSLVYRQTLPYRGPAGPA